LLGFRKYEIQSTGHPKRRGTFDTTRGIYVGSFECIDEGTGAEDTSIDLYAEQAIGRHHVERRTYQFKQNYHQLAARHSTGIRAEQYVMRGNEERTGGRTSAQSKCLELGG